MMKLCGNCGKGYSGNKCKTCDYAFKKGVLSELGKVLELLEKEQKQIIKVCRHRSESLEGFKVILENRVLKLKGKGWK